MYGQANVQPKDLEDLVTRAHPLGPSHSEQLINTRPEVFRQLYDETNHIHRSTRSDDPSYIVGRKGSGKTAFLLGGAIAEDADVVLVQSEDIYTQVNQLRKRYEVQNGPIVVDSLVHVWEVLLFHAAMLGVARSERQPTSNAKTRVWSYMSSFGDPGTMSMDTLLARVSARIGEALLGAPSELSFREACWSIESERGAFLEATDRAREALSRPDSSLLYVVVDNLEDLHRQLDAFQDVIAALFRVTTRRTIVGKAEQFPFKTRFAFPAELLQQLRMLTANAEKDFLDYLTVRWTATELIVIVGNRLRTFLDIYFPAAPNRLKLPRRHDPKDRDAAEMTLRALLPVAVRNGFGSTEDPVAYLLRHTQLLPRHLIQILNEIVSAATDGLEPDDLPQVSPEQIVAGVREAEHRIVEGILATYSYQYPTIATALRVIKNRSAVVETVSQLHRTFNQAGVARIGMEFDEFLDACLAVGALGVVNGDEPGSRYVQGQFSYTFAGELRPVEDRDRLCVHPLFMYRWFDRRAILTMSQATRAVYPYGSDPGHVEVDV